MDNLNLTECDVKMMTRHQVQEAVVVKLSKKLKDLLRCAVFATYDKEILFVEANSPSIMECGAIIQQR